MKRILSVILAAVVLAISLTGCSNISAPEIDEFSIHMTEEEFVTAFEKEIDGELSNELLKLSYEINGNVDETLSVETDENGIQYIVVTVSGATDDKANSVNHSTELFKSVISVLYPDTDMEALSDTLKEIRYIEEENEMSAKSHRFNDTYITYWTNYGPLGLSLSDSSVTQANWKIQTITNYNK